MVKKYRKLPVIVKAVQWAGSNLNEVLNFCGSCAYWDGSFPVNQENGVLIVRTLEGQHVASFEDFIIKDVKRELYLCKPDIFYKTYEEVPDEND